MIERHDFGGILKPSERVHTIILQAVVMWAKNINVYPQIARDERNHSILFSFVDKENVTCGRKKFYQDSTSEQPNRFDNVIRYHEDKIKKLLKPKFREINDNATTTYENEVDFT